MHYVRGIRTRALRKRHGASFLAAARRLLQSIKTADQGCFAKDKNESLFLRQTKRTSENACPFCLMHYVRGIRTRALRKRHGASFLAAARRLLQSIKTADQGCFAKDKNESLFLRQLKPKSNTKVFGLGFLFTKIQLYKSSTRQRIIF